MASWYKTPPNLICLKDPKLKDPKDFKILGQNKITSDAPTKTNGSGNFGLIWGVWYVIRQRGERVRLQGGTLLKLMQAQRWKCRGCNKSGGRLKESWASIIQRCSDRCYPLDGFEGAERNLRLSGIMLPLKIPLTRLNMKSTWQQALVNEDGLIDKNIGNANFLNLPMEKMLLTLYETPMVAHHPLKLWIVLHMQRATTEFMDFYASARFTTGKAVE